MDDHEPRLTAWLTQHVPGLVAPLRHTPLTGGRSNLTSTVEDAASRRLVVRRPPRAPLLATAHDVLREARIVDALATSAVPVPSILATCADCSVVGTPFVVTEHVEGRVLRDSASARAASTTCRAASGPALAQALARLHRLDPTELGLADLARPGDYVGRQVRRWTRQIEAGDGAHRDLLVGLGARVADTVPPQDRMALVHGDPKLDNCLVDGAGNLLALLDWELATIGDPTADLALLLAYWAQPDDPQTALQDPPTAVPGFASRAELVAAYREEAGRQPRQVEAYLAFSFWKLACIVAGVAHRAGSAVDPSAPGQEESRPDRTGPHRYRAQVERLAEMARAALDDVA